MLYYHGQLNCYKRTFDADSGKVENSSLRDESLNANGDQQTLESTPVEYRMPLVWIDLEMTGKLLATELLFH